MQFNYSKMDVRILYAGFVQGLQKASKRKLLENREKGIILRQMYQKGLNRRSYFLYNFLKKLIYDDILQCIRTLSTLGSHSMLLTDLQKLLQ